MYVKSLGSSSNQELIEEIGLYTLHLIKNQNSSSYDESDFNLRNILFQNYIKTEQFSEAANVLAGAKLDSPNYPLSEVIKADTLIKCAGNIITMYFPIFQINLFNFYRSIFRR
jgi:hypothetical protein